LNSSTSNGELERLARAVDGGEGGHHDDHRLRRLLAHRAQQLDAADVGHLHVRDQQFVTAPLHRFQRLAPVRDDRDLVAFAPEDQVEQLPHTPLIIRDQ
jgi:hypothetical protein